MKKFVIMVSSIRGVVDLVSPLHEMEQPGADTFLRREHQPSEWQQITDFDPKNLYWRSPEWRPAVQIRALDKEDLIPL